MAAKWTNEEIDFVIKNHFTMNNFELAQALGRTVRGVGTKRYKIINIEHKIGENNRGWKGYKTISGKEFSNIKWDFLDSYFREMCQLVYNHRGL